MHCKRVNEFVKIARARKPNVTNATRTNISEEINETKKRSTRKMITKDKTNEI